jgi:hypothetical protein
MALKEMREAIIASQAADDIMIDEIDLVSKDFQRVLAKKRAVEPLRMNNRETVQLEQKLGRALATNPYEHNPYNKDAITSESKPVESSGGTFYSSSKEGASSKGASSLNESPPLNATSPFKNAVSKPVTPMHVSRVKIVADSGISFASADAWRNRMPADWKAAPGTIQVVHNGFDSCLIWGAGVDGTPVFDRSKKRFKLVSIRLANQ